MILNDTQTQQVLDHLSSIPGLKPDAREELLDHVCCEIEDKLALGTPFDKAWENTRERWNEDEVQKIHSSTQNSRTMLKLMAAGLIAAVIGLFSLQHASPDPQTTVINREFAPAVFNEIVPPDNHFFSLEREMSRLATEGVQSTRLDPPTTNPIASGHELTAPYGPARHPLTNKKRFHQGIDLKAAKGTPVLAAGAGEVLEAGPKGAYGNCIIIVHDEIYQTLYAHLESVDVEVGDYLEAGQTIGTIGNTGVSTGPHLHYEVIKNGEKVNPANYLP